jgi:flagellar basal body P-ring formation protein FlgA
MVVRGLVLLLLGCVAVEPATALEGRRASRDPEPVAARDLPRGTVLEAGDFRFQASTELEGPVGWVTRRVVNEGEVLRPPTIAPADVVRSGDPVQLVWRSGDLELRLSGHAMGSAAVGEVVRVRVDSRRRFEGTVLEEGIVLLDSPKNGRER